jgi:hypothetical protein
MPQFAVRGYHVERADVVGGVTLGPAQSWAEAAAQRVTDDSHCGVRPVQGCQPRLGSLPDTVGP